MSESDWSMPTETQKWKHFTEGEMACSHCGLRPMDEHFMARLDELRERCGFPLVISSGYRCPEHNEAVSKTGRNGPHTTGQAADILIEGERAYLLVKTAIAMNFRGIGINQKGVGRYIHIDDCLEPRPRIWSY